MTSPALPANAATVVLLREVDALEVFLVRRNTKSAFMASAYVFPGGRVDAADADPRLLALICDASEPDAVDALAEPDTTNARALYIAALRETLEEAGVWLGAPSTAADTETDPRAPAPLRTTSPSALRAQLQAGATLVELAQRHQLAIATRHLRPYARWITPEPETRRFDTRFFVAMLPPGALAAHDGHETVDSLWIRPDVALDRASTGELLLPPPTQRTLAELATCGDMLGVTALLSSRPPPLVDPIVRVIDGAPWIVLPGDPEHPRPIATLPGPTRIPVPPGLLRT